MLGVIQRITPVLSDENARRKTHFSPDSTSDKTTAVQQPEHIIRFYALSAFICVHLRLINSFLSIYFRITQVILCPLAPYFPKYRHSTFFLAQGVRRKNTKLDLMLGSLAKQFILILRDISSHPYFSTR